MRAASNKRSHMNHDEKYLQDKESASDDDSSGSKTTCNKPSEDPDDDLSSVDVEFEREVA